MTMSRIKIKNFGPIKDGLSENNGWLDIKKVTVFIGNQGSGKSSIAKLISTFSWIEKVLTRGDFIEKEFTASKFRKTYCGYHRIENYFLENQTEILYEGDSYSMYYKNEAFSISKKNEDDYALPQIMYIPAERNFISMVNKPNLIRQLPATLLTFLSEYDNAKREMKGALDLPVNNAVLDYDKLNDIVNIKGKDYKVRLVEASSGFQSLVPLYLVSWYLAESVKKQADNPNKMSSDDLKRFETGVKTIWNNVNMSDEQRRVALSALSAKFNKSSFYNIVEEPEQNLYPTSQQKVLYSLLRFNNMLLPNKLVITTHSPYMINYLSIAIQSGYLKTKTENTGLMEKLRHITPVKSTIQSSDVAIYQLDETKGTINKLPDFEGIPSDKNYLNQSLAEGNRIFDSLLEIEQEL